MQRYFEEFGGFLPADTVPAVDLEPRDGAFDRPSPTVSAVRSTLHRCLASVRAVRGSGEPAMHGALAADLARKVLSLRAVIEDPEDAAERIALTHGRRPPFELAGASGTRSHSQSNCSSVRVSMHTHKRQKNHGSWVCDRISLLELKLPEVHNCSDHTCAALNR